MNKKPLYTLHYESFQWFKTWKDTQALLEAEAPSQTVPQLEEVKEDIERALALIMGRFPFFGAFVYKFRILYVPVNDPDITTMATDGKNFFVNPAFAKSLSDAETVFVLCHEILHNVMMHFVRAEAKGVDHGEWNIAADLEINPMLVDEGLLTADEVKNKLHGLYEEKYLGMTAEEIYDDREKTNKMPPLPKSLMDKIKKAMEKFPPGPPSPPQKGGSSKGEEKGEDGGSGSSQSGKGAPGQGASPGKPSEEGTENGIGGILTKEQGIKKQEQLGVPVEVAGEKDGEKMMEEAIRHQDQLKGGTHAGQGKGLLQRAIERFSKPQVDWKNELRRIVGKMLSGREDYFGKRKALARDEYFYGDRPKDRALATAVMPVDLSGSIGEEELRTMLSEIVSVVKTKKIKKTEVVYFDDGISGVDTVKNPPVFDFEKAKGGEGTDFKDPMEYLAKQFKRGKLELAIFCTDGIANLSNFDQKPKFEKRFIWMIIDNPDFKAPFGKVIHVKTKKQDK